ncbi:bifunctional adenosylcobinamide kinase/adenosylcobinamide-phosphate guanylyltransferase [Kutzneria chonburiensis]|uniref:Adenosylcobinamide kinase n=1 Tax=Kutzneria chonburiensis TaxID=1483604 RepID=A0ABV6MJ62_9PSEU|nr:bifunctional adenosylcobinamide kinase/adenosylcobinamide-phosphate guanylyltransferase [Kutzneria chonburiensis]
MTSRTLVLGGARSGKSAHAEGLVTGAVTYVATGRRDPSDTDWQARIAAHVARRPPEWSTLETSDLPAALAVPGTVLVDDLATWLTGVLDDTGAWEGPVDLARSRCDAVIDAVSRRVDPLVLVSAEVGLGVVPATRSGRLFRDELGSLNAGLAQVCDEVLLLVAGLPIRLK